MRDSAGIHLCTAKPGCMAEFYGDGHTVTLSSDAAVMRSIPGKNPKPWDVHAVDADSAMLELQSNHVYRAGELASLALNVLEPPDDFMCEICFTSGSEATEFVAPATWHWYGSAANDNYFIPQSSVRYRVVVLYDGAFMRACAEGVTLS